jgi:hypothetical protein
LTKLIALSFPVSIIFLTSLNVSLYEKLKLEEIDVSILKVPCVAVFCYLKKKLAKLKLVDFKGNANI